MPIDNLGVELETLKKLDMAFTPLRDRMDRTFGMYRQDRELYEIPAAEGHWDYYPVNRATAEGNKIIDYLSYAKRKLFIPDEAEKGKAQKSLSMTEQLAIGLLYLADSINNDVPEYTSLQSLAAFFATMRGWRGYRLLIREDGDKVIPDIAVWDVRNVRWITGYNRLTKVYYTRYATKEEVKDEYKGWNGDSDDKGNCVIVNVFDCSGKGKSAEEGTIVGKDIGGTFTGGEWVREPAVIKVGDESLDYLPIRIKPVRSAPLISDGTDGNIAFMGEDFLASTRELLPAYARLMSYKMTRAGELAKSKNVGYYNSDMGPSPEAPAGVPIKGSWVWMDKSKGQELAQGIVPPTGAEINETLGVAQGDLSKGGLADVAWGYTQQALPAAGIDILRGQAMDAIKTFKMSIETDFVWMAEEVVRQYKMGDFGTMELEGYDKSSNKFKAKVKPEEIGTNWHFTCELVPDLPRDKQANISSAVAAVKGGVMSVKNSISEFSLAADPELEMQRILTEKIESDPYVMYTKAAKAAFDLEDYETAAILMMRRNLLMRQLEGEMGAQPTAGVSSPMPPQTQVGGMTAAMNPQSPTDNRLRMMNMVRGR